MTKSETIGSLAAALAKAQAEMEGARKDATNPHFRSSYSTLASTWDACREALTKNGLSVVQLPSAEGNHISVETLLLHASGEWVASKLTTQARDASPQSVGSALSYLRRYSLASVVGISPSDDDDGEQAQPRVQERPTPQEKPRQDQKTASEPVPQAAQVETPWKDTPDGRSFGEVVALISKVYQGEEGKAERVEWFWRRFASNSREEMPKDWNPAKAWSQCDAKRKASIMETARKLVVSEVPPEER